MQNHFQIDENSKLGYCFYPKQDSHDPGYPGLDIFLRAAPTGQHFDPERVELTIAAVTLQRTGTERLTVHHGWHGMDHYTVYPSRVILYDRDCKKVEAFTFGGKVHIAPEAKLTTVSLVSPAPILNLVQKYPHSIPLRLTSEVEALLAQRRAEWAQRDSNRFKLLLAETNPRTLYRSCLLSLYEKFMHLPHEAQSQGTDQFIHFLQDAVTDLPVATPLLSELL